MYILHIHFTFSVYIHSQSIARTPINHIYTDPMIDMSILGKAHQFCLNNNVHKEETL